MLKRLAHRSRYAWFAFLALSLSASAQDNSPYSRYGLGDRTPGGNITSQGMGGITSGYADIVSVNFANPASYSQFQAYIEQRNKKVSNGRVVLDVGINFSNRTLVKPNTPGRFTSSDFLFNYIQIGLPIRRNWGMSFGIRPLSRISYRVNRFEYLRNPTNGNAIDSAATQFRGSGGSYLPNIGTGFGFSTGSSENNKTKTSGNLSLGANVGYLFGSRESQALRTIYNDSVGYYAADFTTNSSFGDVFFNAGLQYQVERYNKADKSTTTYRFGLSGNIEQKLKGRQDVLRQTFTRDQGSGAELQLDSVFQQNDIEGQITYPASYKGGFLIQHVEVDNSGWMFGVDYSTQNWKNYRFFGNADSVQNSWMLHAGGQIFPKARTSYFSRVIYRFGLYGGRDYVRVNGNLPVYGASFGMGLPIGGGNRFAINQYSVVNVALEYMKRGNNDNLLKENTFRVSVGFNFTDLWFGKRKYE